MGQTVHINDISNPRAKAFLELIKTLDFISLDDNKHNAIPQWQQELTLKRLAELDKDPSKSIDFDQMLNRLESKYGL
jgi:hypothetical protein